MASTDQTKETKQSPADFFEAIGSRVEAMGTSTNGAATEDDDVRPVDEIESLCMSCGKNVSRDVYHTPSCR